MSVNVMGLTKTFGAQNAVDNISFEAKEGEILGFLGPNGAGKSTTMKIATCYLPPTSGTIKVCDQDVKDNSMDVRKNIGYLPEHNPLYLDMYVHEYLHFTGSLHLKNAGEIKKQVKKMIEICGLEREQNKKIGALSKGYRQRVGLAQALLHDPKVLILDEPTTGLDPNQIIEIRNLIKSISRDKTVIFSTHIMQEVQALCDRVVIINKGIIVADATPGELMKLQSKPRIIVQFKETIDEADFKKFTGVEEVDNMGENKFKLTPNDNEDIRPKIYQYSTEKKLTLLQLTEQESQIEDIFRQLTIN